MDEAAGNPPTNRLPGGVTDQGILAAIESSGYGLQSVAADKIIATAEEMLGTERPPLDGSVRSRVDCQEEWAYIDADSQETRQLDGLIALDVTSAEYKPYPDSPRETIRCSLDLLIECKQSELPFLFFMRRANTGDVPRIVGLPHEWLSIGTDDHPDIHLGMRPYDALGFYSLPLARRPSTAISMTKAQWKSGSVLQLSGEDVFRGIALPLSKAVRYYETMIKPKEPTLYRTSGW
jgi:hypothetical protein